MRTFQEIKEDFAKENDFDSWGDFLFKSVKSELNMAIDIISEEVAKEIKKETIEAAQKNLYFDFAEDIPAIEKDAFDHIKLK